MSNTTQPQSVGPFVYFMTAGPFVKIGLSRSPVTRLAELRPWNPMPIRLSFVIRGDRRVEQLFQLCFAEYHERGEWYRIAGRLAAFLGDQPAVSCTQERTDQLIREAHGYLIANPVLPPAKPLDTEWSDKEDYGPLLGQLIIANALREAGARLSQPPYQGGAE